MHACNDFKVVTATLPPQSPNRKQSVSLRGGSADLRAIGKLVRDLPQYREQLSRLAAHVELATALTKSVDEGHLTDLGKLEQDLVYGDATSKEVIALLSSPELTLRPEDRVRLLICYSATHLEKLDPTREQQWQRVAGLSAEQLAPLARLEYLAVPVYKRSKNKLAATLSFGRKRHRATRKDRGGEDEQEYALSRFVPLLQEVLEDAASGQLSTDEYPWVQPPSSSGTPVSARGGSYSSPAATPPAAVASARTIRTTGTWAKAKASESSEAPGSSAHETSTNGSQRRKLFCFVVGGMTYSEMRAAHRLSARLGRDVFLGSTHIETPTRFLADLSSIETPSSSTSVAAFELETPLREKY